MHSIAAVGRQRLERLGLAVLAVAAGLLVSQSVQPLVGERGSLLVFVLSVVWGAWSGGFGPGILATGLGALATVYFLLPPVYSFRVAGRAGWSCLALFTLEGILISWVCERRQRAERQRRDMAARSACAWSELSTAKRELALARREVARLRTAGGTDSSAALEAAVAGLSLRPATVAHGPLPVVPVETGELVRVFHEVIGASVASCEPPATASVVVSAGCLPDHWLFAVACRGASLGRSDGLADSRRTVERLGGRLWITPRPNSATVLFSLPR